MEYIRILREQAKKLNIAYRYWPYYLYHFSDIHNIVNILKDGVIYSRNEVNRRGIMSSDNSSKRVIEKTKEEAFKYARLYFRPLTPTQFHSEGYKPPAIRDHEMNASCPVPVFLILDADIILSSPDVSFVEQGIAGAGHILQQGIEDFEKLHFDKIYDNRVYSGEKWSNEKKYRMSEVISPNGFKLDNSLRAIVCRSEAEKQTLDYLLREKDRDLYEKYKSKIYIRADFECFFYNGLFVNSVNIHGNVLDIDFDTPAERRYKVAQVEVKLVLTMRDNYDAIVDEESFKWDVDYDSSGGLQIPINIPVNVETVEAKVTFDGIEMYKNAIFVKKEILV